MDGMGQGHQPNYFAAVSDLARDVGGIEAQVNERVTYKELMAQNTQQRHEITSRIEKVEEHLSETMRQSVVTLETRIEAIAAQLSLLAQSTAAASAAASAAATAAATSRNNGPGRVAIGSITTTLGAGLGVGGYLLLRSFGVAP